MKNNNEFNFFVGIDIDEEIYKSSTESKAKNRYDRMLIKGLASDNSTDSEGEIMEPAGFEINEFLKSGLLNLEHYTSRKGDSKYWIGEPTDGLIKGNEFYVAGKLWKAHELARSYWDTILIMKASGSKRKPGFSIEGQAKERDPLNKKRVTKAKINHLACTLAPVNKNSWADIVKGQQKEDFVQPSIINIDNKYIYKFEKSGKSYGLTKDFKVEEIGASLRKVLPYILKSLRNDTLSFSQAKKIIEKVL